jgi:signal transduction histidine kinase
LSHVEQAPYVAATPLVKLVSLVDASDGHELMLKPQPSAAPLRLSYARNTMTFRFYSGSDNWRRPPVYEYRMDDREPWTPVSGSSFTFRGLREGAYRFQVRLAGRPETTGASSVLPFEVQPPWYRTRVAYVLFALAAVSLLAAVVAWLSYTARKRNRQLERVVDERTGQLQAAMDKLNLETRNAATREERDRLASEIHDSLQQGLTGAILQLDTTLRLSAVVDEVRSRLHVVRNMISYARQEVQHAVWDMESPLLEGTELGDALRNLTAFVESESVLIEVVVSGAAVPLSRGANHNLLRIAQEATTNAVRHAQAKRITIRLDYDAAEVALEVADDGIGFLPELVLGKQIGHFGLRGIRTRAKKLRADLSIESVPGKGTTIRVRVPTALNSDLHSHVERSHR